MPLEWWAVLGFAIVPIIKNVLETWVSVVGWQVFCFLWDYIMPGWIRCVPWGVRVKVEVAVSEKG